MEPYCPEDAYCEMIAEVTRDRRLMIEAKAREFLGKSPRERVVKLADLLEDMAAAGARGVWA